MSCIARALARERQWQKSQRAKRSKIAREACKRAEFAKWNTATKPVPRYADD